MLLFISRAQAIDNVILMQSIRNVGFNNICKLTVCMCENWFQQNQTNMAGIHLMKNRFQKSQTNKAGNRFQICSDIFCRKYFSMKNRFQQNQPNAAGRNTSLMCETWVPTKFSNLSKSRTKQSWRTNKIIGLKVPGHGLNGTISKREHQ